MCACVYMCEVLCVFGIVYVCLLCLILSKSPALGCSYWLIKKILILILAPNIQLELALHTWRQMKKAQLSCSSVSIYNIINMLKTVVLKIILLILCHLFVSISISKLLLQLHTSFSSYPLCTVANSPARIRAISSKHIVVLALPLLPQLGQLP